MTADFDLDAIECEAAVAIGRGAASVAGSADLLLALVVEVRHLRAANDDLRGLLARALPWIDPNDSHDDYLLVVECEEALR